MRRHHEDAIAHAPLIAGEDVGRQIGADDLPGVEGAVGVGPGNAYEHLLCHGGFSTILAYGEVGRQEEQEEERD